MQGMDDTKSGMEKRNKEKIVAKFINIKKAHK